MLEIFVRELLGPMFMPGESVVMNNLGAYKDEGVYEAIGFDQTAGWRSVIVVPLSTSAAQARRGPTAVAIARNWRAQAVERRALPSSDDT